MFSVPGLVSVRAEHERLAGASTAQISVYITTRGMHTCSDGAPQLFYSRCEVLLFSRTKDSKPILGTWRCYMHFRHLARGSAGSAKLVVHVPSKELPTACTLYYRAPKGTVKNRLFPPSFHPKSR